MRTALVVLVAVADAAGLVVPRRELSMQVIKTRASHISCSISDVFSSWATDAKIDLLAPLKLAEFDGGVRGVAAGAPLAAGARVIAVPAKLALQVTTQQPCPRWFDESAWKELKWDGRLALSLLRMRALQREGSAQRDAEIGIVRARWLAILPETFETPIFWSPEDLKALGYPPLEAAVQKQRADWDGIYARVCSALPEGAAAAAGGPAAAAGAEPSMQLARPSKPELYWALSNVRSRAFSGPFSTGTLKGSIGQLGFATVLAGIYGASGMGSLEDALNGWLAVLFSLIISDLLFSRITPAKRYVMCPWLDLLNHRSDASGSELAYEYFSDSFAATTDPTTGATGSGDEIFISYGERSNEQLLQYYGFVEQNNPYDRYVTTQESFLLLLSRVCPFEPQRLQRLRDAQLVDSTTPISFGRSAPDERALQLTRLMLHEEEELVENGRSPSADVSAEVRVLRALADCALEDALAFDQPIAIKGAAASLAVAFRAEKATLLRSCAAELSALADSSEAAGVLRLPTTLAEQPDKAASKLPGLGLSRVK